MIDLLRWSVYGPIGLWIALIFLSFTAQRLAISNKCIQLYLCWFLQILLEKVVYAKGRKVFSDENNFQVKGPI